MCFTKTTSWSVVDGSRVTRSSRRGNEALAFPDGRVSRLTPTATLEEMKSADKFFIVLVTAPDLKTARKLARSALKAKLIACANLVPQIESHYWWQGKIESSAEVLLVLKTTQGKLAKLERVILAEHPYDTPEFVVLPLRAGSQRYLTWLAASVEA